MLSSEHIRNERFALRYILPPGEAVNIPRVLHHERMQWAFANKMLRTIDAILGTDEKMWRSVGLFFTLEKIIYRAASVITMGPELAEDEVFQRAFSGLATWLGAGIVVVGELTPSPFKILTGYAFRVPIGLYLRRCTRLVNVVFKKQLKMHEAQLNEETEEKPTSLLTIVAQQSMSKSNHPGPDAAARQLVINVSNFLSLPNGWADN